MALIAVDIDDTLSMMVQELLDEFNLRSGESLEMKDITGWNLEEACKPENAHLFMEIMNEPGWFFRPKPREDALEFVPKLCEQHTVVVAGAYYPCSCLDKVNWIKKYYPCIDSKNIIFINHKHLLKVDAIVDDGLHNMDSANGKLPILLDKPWNQTSHLGADVCVTSDKVRRAYNWSEVYNIIQEAFN